MQRNISTHHVGGKVKSDDDIDDKEDGRGRFLRIRLHHHVRIAERAMGAVT